MRRGLRAARTARERRVARLVGLVAVLTLTLVLSGVATSGAAAASGGSGLTIPLPLGLPPIVLGGTPSSGGATTTTSAPATTVAPPAAPAKASNPLSGRAMWIWELPQSSGGSLSQIVATAKRYGVRTLIVKSSDGTTGWSQFTRAMVATMKAAGLQVCAWQYVYGRHPADEARLGAGAVQEGAACLIIDAETEYQGRYAAAQRYLTLLRQRVGANYPLGLAGFAYVDYHPGFPYSVFLGPGGAQYNLPQMYWRDIGTSVDTVYAHTYLYNRLYERPIYPLGQVFQNPPASQLVRFRQLSQAYGAPGVSWWDYQEATAAGWRAISKPAGRLSGYAPDAEVATLARKAKGDIVVWAQEHLITAGYPIAVDGDFGSQTQAAVEQFQAAHALPVTGVLDAATWAALLRYAPAVVHWGTGASKKAVAAVARAARARVARGAAVARAARAGRRAGTGVGAGADTATGARGLTPPPISATLPGRSELRGRPPGRGGP